MEAETNVGRRRRPVEKGVNSVLGAALLCGSGVLVITGAIYIAGEVGKHRREAPAVERVDAAATTNYSILPGDQSCPSGGKRIGPDGPVRVTAYTAEGEVLGSIAPEVIYKVDTPNGTVKVYCGMDLGRFAIGTHAAIADGTPPFVVKR